MLPEELVEEQAFFIRWVDVLEGGLNPPDILRLKQFLNLLLKRRGYRGGIFIGAIINPV